MSSQFVPIPTAAAFDHNSTLVLALELSSKSWEVGSAVPGVVRCPFKKLPYRDIDGLLQVIDRWRQESVDAGRTICRTVLVYEAGQDGFWIARCLEAHGIEVHIVHAASIPVKRGRRRVKTDRIDLDHMLRTFLAWLRGEPRVCSMVRIPSIEEEDARWASRERERLVSERVQLENSIRSLLMLHGAAPFNPRLKKAMIILEMLCRFDGSPLPDKAMSRLRRAMERHQVVGDQIKQVEAERDEVMKRAALNREEKMIQNLAGIYGLGVETATILVREMLCRRFKDRRAVAGFAGLTGTPFRSGRIAREQGIGRTGNARVRRIMMQLVWRWVRFQPDSPLTSWYMARTGGIKGRLRKIMAVAMARKLLIVLWRFAQTGEVPHGVKFGSA